MVAASGYLSVNSGATAGDIGMTRGIEVGGFSIICLKRATAAMMPVCRSSRSLPARRGS